LSRALGSRRVPDDLKNVVDWFNRGDDQPFAHKPVAIVTASPGPVGGARVQYDLRKVMLFLNVMPLIKPEVFIGGAPSQFDAATGRCADETTRKFVVKQMAAFRNWIDAVKRLTSVGRISASGTARARSCARLAM
jgi:chromate reductase